MFPQLSDTRCPAIMATLVALPLLLPARAQAQDSFARFAEPATGAPVLSVLGTGIGMAFASLTLELHCPAGAAWTFEVTGVRAPPGTAVSVGFGDAEGGWTPIRSDARHFDNRSLTVAFDGAAFGAALSAARAEFPAAQEAVLRVVVGEAVGVAVSRDDLAREMTDFARDCDAAPTDSAGRRFAYSR